MSVLDLFNQVELKLKQIAEQIAEVREVTVSEQSLSEGFKTPRVFVWIREGESQPATIGGEKRRHRWRFEYVIDVVMASAESAYDMVKRIAWSLYNLLMNNRTLDGLVLNVDPAARFFRIESPSERVYGHRWVMYVDVYVEA